MTRLAAIVQEALDYFEWTDEIEDDEEAGKSRVTTGAMVEGQPCDIYIDTHEQLDAISIFFYLPFRVTAKNYPQACMLINAINVKARHGHLEILQDGGRIRLVASADIEGATPTGIFVVRMVQLADATLSDWMWALAAVAVSGQTADALLAEAARREGGDETVEETAAEETARPIPQAAAKTLH
jgi:hypothetical protein